MRLLYVYQINLRMNKTEKMAKQKQGAVQVKFYSSVSWLLATYNKDAFEFINFLNSYSSNSTIVLATSKDIGKPGPLIDKLIYEKGNSLHCPLVIINGNLEDKEIEKII